MRIINLKKALGNFHLNIPDMEFEPGKIHGIIGGNGSGKTTLAKVIMGVHEPDEGHIDYEDVRHDECTMLTQRPYLLHDTVYQNLIYPLKLRKMKIDENQVDEWLRFCGLLDKKKQYARSLSSGERQKLAFARAMIFSPKLVIIDETFSNLDPDSVRLFEEWILDRQKENPITWIIISHQLVHICKVCDVVHFMEKGEQLASGNVEEMLLSPEHPAICKYLASMEVSYKGKEIQ